MKIIIADDHEMLRQSLSLMLQLNHDFEICATAKDHQEAIAACQKHDPDVLLLDYLMPRGHCIDTIEQVKALHPKIRVIVMTGETRKEIWNELLDSSANGLVSKMAGQQDLEAAIEHVMNNPVDPYCSPQVRKLLVE